MSNMVSQEQFEALMRRVNEQQALLDARGSDSKRIPDVTMTPELSAFIQAMTTDFQTSNIMADIEQFAKSVEYVGLDVRKMRAYISHKLKQGTAAPNTPQHELQRAVTIALKRGNNHTNILNSLEGEARATVARIGTMIGIKDKVAGSPAAITYSRILICFPEVAALIASKIKSTGPVLDALEGYPYCMRQGFFAGLLSVNRNADEQKIYKAFCFFSCKISQTLDKKHPQLSKDMLTRQETFILNGARQSSLTPQRKAEMLRKPEMGIYVNNVLNHTILQYASSYDALKGEPTVPSEGVYYQPPQVPSYPQQLPSAFQFSGGMQQPQRSQYMPASAEGLLGSRPVRSESPVSDTPRSATDEDE